MRTTDNRCWEVVTPEYCNQYGWNEPPEPFVDVVYVLAPDRATAKRLGIRALRRLYPHGWIGDGENPLNVKVHLAPSCPHRKKGDGWPTHDGAACSDELCARGAAEFDEEFSEEET